MADITMCTDEECPMKHLCYRYTAPACPYRQAYFVKSPKRKKLDGYDCDYFWSRYTKDKKDG